MATRRDHLAGLGLAGLGLTAAGFGLGATAGTARAAPTPAPSPSPSQEPPAGPLALTARRTELTLPDLPTLAVPYVCLLDLFDEAGAQVGTATAAATVVGVTAVGPVVLATVVLQLAGGEIHYQRVMDRFGAYPRTVTGPVLGGTGDYRGAVGEAEITWPDPDRVDLELTFQPT